MIDEGLLRELDEVCPLPEGAPAPVGGGLLVIGNTAGAVTKGVSDLIRPDHDARRAERFVSSIVNNPHVSRRRSWPIIGYIGENGSGKTFSAVRDTLPSLVRGRPVCSTTPLYDPLLPGEVLHKLYRPLQSWREITTLRDSDLLLDEVQSVANSRGASSIPPQLLTAFLQLRKRGVVLRWTTTHWTRIDVSLREVTKAAVICSSYRVDRKAPVTVDGWRPMRKFSVRTCDAASLDGAYTIQLGDDKPVGGVRTLDKERFTRRRWWPWLYDSKAVVEVLDHVDAGGWCMTCGGTRKRHVCKCGDIHHSTVTDL